MLNFWKVIPFHRSIPLFQSSDCIRPRVRVRAKKRKALDVSSSCLLPVVRSWEGLVEGAKSSAYLPVSVITVSVLLMVVHVSTHDRDARSSFREVEKLLMCRDSRNFWQYGRQAEAVWLSFQASFDRRQWCGQNVYTWEILPGYLRRVLTHDTNHWWESLIISWYVSSSCCISLTHFTTLVYLLHMQISIWSWFSPLFSVCHRFYRQHEIAIYS